MIRTMIRIGQGSDIHQLVPGRQLIIGGVNIPYPSGLLGHSDADVLLHAIIDALLGAAALGDIGTQFPDKDDAYRDADSRVLLRSACDKLTQSGWEIINIDSTIHAEMPKMAPHIPAMRANIAADLNIEKEQISIKAKTAERLGFVGREEGIMCEAVALIRRDEEKK